MEITAKITTATTTARELNFERCRIPPFYRGCLAVRKGGGLARPQDFCRNKIPMVRLHVAYGSVEPDHERHGSLFAVESCPIRGWSPARSVMPAIWGWALGVAGE